MSGRDASRRENVMKMLVEPEMSCHGAEHGEEEGFGPG